jgi:hypothetical protein
VQLRHAAWGSTAASFAVGPAGPGVGMNHDPPPIVGDLDPGGHSDSQSQAEAFPARRQAGVGGFRSPVALSVKGERHSVFCDPLCYAAEEYSARLRSGGKDWNPCWERLSGVEGERECPVDDRLHRGGRGFDPCLAPPSKSTVSTRSSMFVAMVNGKRTPFGAMLERNKKKARAKRSVPPRASS